MAKKRAAAPAKPVTPPKRNVGGRGKQRERKPK